MDTQSSSDSTLENMSWRGTSMDDMCKGKGPWSFGTASLTPSKYHCVLFKLPVTLQAPPSAHHSRDLHLWDDDHVRMPHSNKNLFSVIENDSDVIKERWKIICNVLSEPINTSKEFEAALNKYNNPLPKFEALHYFFDEELDQEESNQFFTVLLPKIVALALRLPGLLPNGIPLLKQNHNRSLSLSQLQISCLLANAFLCTFPWKKNIAATYPGVNFVSLFSSFSRPKRKHCICEKLKCICNYFRRVTETEPPLGVVTFERKMIPRSSMPRWDTASGNIGNTKVHISSEGTIEDNGLGCLQVDFANKNIGGGVLRYGCVQEEIRFVICPELIVSRLFVEQLGNGEAVIITGAERFNNYNGYGDTFEWTGNCNDHTPFDVYGRRKTSICVIDAIRFHKPKEQFQMSFLLRELNKAYAGFSTRDKGNVAPVATGNWGCGAFNGSKQLKTLIQLMACTQSNRDLVYFSFGDVELMENFYNIYLFLGNNRITIAQLWRFLCQFAVRNLDESKLYSFIQQAYFDSKRQPTISNFFTKQETTSKSESQMSPRKEKSHEANMDIVTESFSTSSSSEEIISSSQPELEVPRKFIRLKAEKRTDKNLSDKMPTTDIGKIFDMLDGNGNDSKTYTNKNEHTANDVLAVFDKYTRRKSDGALQEVVILKEEDELAQQASSKKKITDFFSKINK